MKKFMGILIAVILVISAVPAVMANDYEIQVECEACNELLTTQDIIYNEDEEAMCIYCEEILSQKVIDALFYEEEEEEQATVCPNCGETLTEEEMEIMEDGTIICYLCEEEEEIYETDDPDESPVLPEDTVGVQLNTSEWAKAEADVAYAKGLIPLELLGVDLKTDVTREQFAAIAVTLYEKITGIAADDSTENLPFTDCRANGSFTRYVAAAYKLGITNGTSETTFAPEQIITREQLATMLYRVIAKAQAEGVLPKETEISHVEFAFDDDSAISDYAKESVYYMAQRSIIKGMTETTFAPQGVATKEQAILISNRIEANLY